MKRTGRVGIKKVKKAKKEVKYTKVYIEAYVPDTYREDIKSKKFKLEPEKIKFIYGGEDYVTVMMLGAIMDFLKKQEQKTKMLMTETEKLNCAFSMMEVIEENGIILSELNNIDDVIEDMYEEYQLALEDEEAEIEAAVQDNLKEQNKVLAIIRDAILDDDDEKVEKYRGQLRELRSEFDEEE